jgi:hypothetical protein
MRMTLARDYLRTGDRPAPPDDGTGTAGDGIHVG